MLQCEFSSFIPTVFKNGGRFLTDDELKEKGVFPNSLGYYPVSDDRLVLGFVIAQSQKHGTWSIAEGCVELGYDLKKKDRYSNAVFYLTGPMKGFVLREGDTPPQYVNKMPFTEVAKLFRPENMFLNNSGYLNRGYIVVNEQFKIVRRPPRPETKLPF